MADEVKVEEEQIITPQVEDDEFNYVVTDEEEKPVDEEKLKIQTELAEAQAEIDKLRQMSQSANIENTSQKQMEELANVIKNSMQSAIPSPPQVNPQEDYLKKVEEIRKDWHSDPAGNVLKLIEPLMQQMQGSVNSRVNTMAMSTSKTLAVSGADAGIYSKYSDEVEAIASSLPPSETVYQDAIKQVKANHLDDIIAEKVAEQLAGKVTENKLTPDQVAQRADTTLSGAPQVGNAQVAAEQKSRITKAEEAKLQQYALQKGIPWHVEKYRNLIVKNYKNGGIRV